MALDPFLKKTLRELVKHAQRDGCYSCKQILRDFAKRWGIDADKFLEDMEKQ